MRRELECSALEKSHKNIKGLRLAKEVGSRYPGKLRQEVIESEILS